MSHNVTLATVKSAFSVVKIAAESAGVNSENWALKIGSATNGNTFGIVDVDPTNGGQSPVQTFGFTRADAYITMEGMTSAFTLAARARLS